MAQESSLTTIRNLAQSCLDDFEEMDVQEQLDFTQDVLKQIIDICNKELGEEPTVMHEALALAIHNLCVRNNINPHDFIETMRETRENFKNNKEI